MNTGEKGVASEGENVKDDIIVGEGDGGVHEKEGWMESRDRGISLKKRRDTLPFSIVGRRKEVRTRPIGK